MTQDRRDTFFFFRALQGANNEQGNRIIIHHRHNNIWLLSFDRYPKQPHAFSIVTHRFTEPNSNNYSIAIQYT